MSQVSPSQVWAAPSCGTGAGCGYACGCPYGCGCGTPYGVCC
ncbi:hypothetical protein [Streptomyces clavuligerus]|nr:hypothetical protein [Streptomyces clavuligerus]